MSQPLRAVERLIVDPGAVERLEREVEAAGDTEACGLLSGAWDAARTARATRATTLPNLSRSRASFAVDPARLIEERRRIEANGRQVLALYHSHPKGSCRPSGRDLQLPRITKLLTLILAREDDGMHAACYTWTGERVAPVQVVTCRTRQTSG